MIRSVTANSFALGPRGRGDPDRRRTRRASQALRDRRRLRLSLGTGAISNMVSRINPKLNTVTATIAVGDYVRPDSRSAREPCGWSTPETAPFADRPRAMLSSRRCRSGEHVTGSPPGPARLGNGRRRPAHGRHERPNARPSPSLPLSSCSPIAMARATPDLLIARSFRLSVASERRIR